LWNKDKSTIRIRKSFLLSGLCFLMLSGCSLLPEEEPDLAPPLVKPAQESLETVEAVSGTIVNEVKGIGNFVATSYEHHRFEEAQGTVLSVLVKPGDEVKTGDVLIQLDVEGLDVKAKEQQLALEKARIGLRKAKESKDEEQIKLQLMELELAQLYYNKTITQLNNRTMTAKMDGKITFMEKLEPYDYINERKILVTVSDPKELRIEMEQAEVRTLDPVKVGMKADVIFRGQELSGTVVQAPSSAPSTDNADLKVRYTKLVIVQLDELPNEVEMGNTAEIIIPTEKRENTIILPKRALRNYLDRDFVHILDGESRREVDVEVGITTSTEVEIVKGLEEGQSVILQ
jgi:multidrug efflux pump subunit AcrA (membrane-fusion protein)